MRASSLPQSTLVSIEPKHYHGSRNETLTSASSRIRDQVFRQKIYQVCLDGKKSDIFADGSSSWSRRLEFSSQPNAAKYQKSFMSTTKLPIASREPLGNTVLLLLFCVRKARHAHLWVPSIPASCKIPIFAAGMGYPLKL